MVVNKNKFNQVLLLMSMERTSFDFDLISESSSFLIKLILEDDPFRPHRRNKKRPQPK